MRIQPKAILFFDTPTTADLTGIQLYYGSEGTDANPLTDNAASIFVPLSLVTPGQEPGKSEIDLNNSAITFPGGLVSDGNALFAVAGVDDVGNIGDLSETFVVPLDSEAPAVITGVGYRQP